MKIIYRDLLSIEDGIICHQVNTLGIMGSGIAKTIRIKWPSVYFAYQKIHHEGKLVLGCVQLVQITSELTVANVVGQATLGGIATDYNAIRDAFTWLNNNKGVKQIYVPFGMGCALAGGDWNKYSAIIDEVCPGSIACKLEGI